MQKTRQHKKKFAETFAIINNFSYFCQFVAHRLLTMHYYYHTDTQLNIHHKTHISLINSY